MAVDKLKDERFRQKPSRFCCRSYSPYDQIVSKLSPPTNKEYLSQVFEKFYMYMQMQIKKYHIANSFSGGFSTDPWRRPCPSSKELRRTRSAAPGTTTEVRKYNLHSHNQIRQGARRRRKLQSVVSVLMNIIIEVFHTLRIFNGRAIAGIVV